MEESAGIRRKKGKRKIRLQAQDIARSKGQLKARARGCEGKVKVGRDLQGSPWFSTEVLLFFVNAMREGFSLS